MITHLTELVVPNAKAKQFYDFMIEPNSKTYHEWFPEEHKEFYIKKRSNNENHLGDKTYVDESLDEKYRIRFSGLVTKVTPSTSIEWKMTFLGIVLPAVLTIDFNDSDKGVVVVHKLEIGYKGIGKFLDAFIRLYFTKSYARALTNHCNKEWPRFAEYLNKSKDLTD